MRRDKNKFKRRDPSGFRKRVEAYKNGTPIDEIYDGGYIKEPVITPDPQYNEYVNSLPDNQRLTPESQYRSHRYWELNDKPKNFAEAIGKGMFEYNTGDNSWHANSAAFNKDTGEYEFMKPNWHDTKMYEDAWYYSKEGENFRSKYLRQPGAAYDKYIPKHKNGKLPGYYEGELPMGERRQLTDEEVKQVAQNASHEQGMSGEDPLLSTLVGMKALRLLGDQLSSRRLRQKAELYKRVREANDQTRDASRAWKIQDADRYARSWGLSDDPVGFLYDIFLDPIANMYTKIQKHPILGPLIPFNDGKLPGYSNGKIRIKPANRGKFNATKKRTGKTTEELTHSKNPLTRKRAIFAQNARKWNHK